MEIFWVFKLKNSVLLVVNVINVKYSVVFSIENFYNVCFVNVFENFN